MPAALIGCGLLATDAIYLLTSCFDWGPVALEHLLLLQEKLNAYLNFIESGEVERKYPAAAGKKFVILVMTANEPSEGARTFLSRAREVIQSAGFDLEQRALGR